MCKGFGSTLSRPALRWLVSLPNRSISTFVDLVNAFTQQFASSRKPQKHAGDLYRIVHGASETIGEYNTRFNNEKVAVRECDLSTTVEAFRRGLHYESDLYKQLTMHPCHSFEAVQEKAAAAIRLEEDILARANIPSTPSVSSTSAMEKSNRKQSTSKKEERYRPYGRGVNRIDNKEENQQLSTLAEEIRRLYEQGEMSHLLPRGGKQQDKVGSAKPATPPTCTKIINVITGGSDLSGLTYSAAKRRATETKGDKPKTSCRTSHSDLPSVAFDEEDVDDGQEHHDALIITLSMANCTVRKVLVDTGSSVNQIMLKTIENMGFSEKDLQKKIIPLVGFSGETAKSLGEIVIPTYAGGVNKQVRGIEANTEQVKAVLQLESPEKPKDVQRIAGKVAALSRFISRSSEKCRIFYNILRKSQKFEWTADHDQAFRELKHYPSTPPLLSKPEQGEPLFLYLAVTEVEVSAVLVREQGKEQKPVYYVRKFLQPA
ncbi:uncharacterized protein LOC141628558 [Silene latifolia]|uniref:uncharacterized protein LOC141628558 n=1 Tax=Silene latifolia TaxID=37657 RepID=UPI003D7712B3